MMLVTYFVIASVSGLLTFQLRRNQRILKSREEKTRALYDILASLTSIQGTQPLIEVALSKIESLFQATCAVLLSKDDNLPEILSFGTLVFTESERAVALWSYEHGRMAGWSTDTLPSSAILCIVLQSGEEKLGVLVFKPDVDKKLTQDQRELLVSIANQMGLALLKQKRDQDAKQTSLLKESEKLHQTLLHCVSHELRTPLTAIMGAATALQSQAQEPSMQVLSDEIVHSSERLNHIFQNLLDVTRLESGVVKVKREWFDLTELIHFTVDKQKKLLSDHQIKLTLEPTPIYLFGGFDLLEHALTNLLVNAANYSPLGSVIVMKTSKQTDNVMIEIKDQGPGIPLEHMSHLFEKFYRLPESPLGGLGLGLSITKNIVELHGGTIQVQNNADRGATFAVGLPYQDPPLQIQEDKS